MDDIAGTPQYMSPEQARGEQLDQQSDLFSLGSLLYALCTGRPPFRDDTSYGVMRKIIDEVPAPIRKLSPQTPVWMAALVEQLMAKKKEDRFASAKEVHALLDACLSHVQQPSSNPIPSKLVNNQPSHTKKKLMKVFIGIGILLLAMSATFVQLRSNYFNSKLTENQVLHRLSEVDGYIDLMMQSRYEGVFLNLGSIGKDNNYLSLKPIDGGVDLKFPAYDTNDFWNKRQAKYVDRLMAAANSLALPSSEKSELENDGSVRGINYEYRVIGDPEAVAHTIKRVITETFQIDETAECDFTFNNMPGNYSTRAGQKPRELSNEDFVREFASGNYVYMGEQKASVFLIPKDLAVEIPVTLDSKILYTDVRTLDPEDVKRIRSSK